MSQKKMKKLRKMDTALSKKEVDEPVPGIREILKKNWKFLLLLILLVVGIYFNSLAGAFVSDDYATIPQNPQIMSFKYGLSGWMGGLINWFLAVVFGITSPIAYHITSLLLYIGVILAAFVFCSLGWGSPVTSQKL